MRSRLRSQYTASGRHTCLRASSAFSPASSIPSLPFCCYSLSSTSAFSKASRCSTTMRVCSHAIHSSSRFLSPSLEQRSLTFSPVLTQRKYGVATIWYSQPFPSPLIIWVSALTRPRLVATLGSKSTLTKRVSRKQISDVDLPKACNTIVTPAAPLALRLQSNLL